LKPCLIGAVGGAKSAGAVGAPLRRVLRTPDLLAEKGKSKKKSICQQTVSRRGRRGWAILEKAERTKEVTAMQTWFSREEGICP